VLQVAAAGDDQDLGAAVQVPKRWYGRKVHCILVEEPEDDGEKD